MNMNAKSLLSLSTFIIAGFTMTLIGQKPATASEPIFFCESEQDIPTTIAKNKNGQVKSILNWNLTQLDTPIQPEELCESVTQKLNQYHQDGNDLSSLVFKASTILNDEDATILPVICISGTEEQCQVDLFKLSPAPNPQATASQVLDSILAQELQTGPLGSQTRGLQSTSYEVNFWQLLGF